MEEYIASRLSKKSEVVSGSFKGIRRDDNKNIILRVVAGTFIDNQINASAEDIWNFGSPKVAPQSDIEFTLGGLTCKRLGKAHKK